MNYNKEKLEETKKLYQALTWTFTKNDKKVPGIYNTILDLIEDIEELGDKKK